MPATEVARKDVSPRRLQWLTATVNDVIDETPRTRTLVLDVPEWPGHRAGQHVDVRLTGDDGYQAQRSYSIASAPEDTRLMLTVERIEDGEVSPYLAGDVQAGDQFELRGPIGGYFVWTAALGGPLFLVAGGSGVVPLMAMLRHHTRPAGHQEQRAPVRGPPDEVPADRTAQLEAVARPYLVDEVRRDLAAVDALDRELEQGSVRSRRDRVAALRLVPVLAGQPHHDVLAGEVPRPAGHLEREGADACGLRAHRGHGRHPPGRARRRVSHR